MTEKGIEVVMNALAGTPTVVTADFANEVEQILREKIQIEKENGGNYGDQTAGIFSGNCR